MAKFLIRVGYTAEGLKGLMNEKAAGRTAAVKKAVASVGGKLDALYWALGEDDAISIVDLPDAETAAALGMALGASGLVRTRTTRLLTADEIDVALGKSVKYRAPGK
ncbi:MAG: GYD domain protein [Alphaproteobacteria bacterium 64-11]|nr:GYD domain-containing protein [Alphaproteobacteria bacterium]OJU08868.1 MAG: GYD domain protein [Alphaproteobacteria bacterium 64-11]